MAYPLGVLTGFSALAVLGLVDSDPWTVVRAHQRPWIRLDRHQRVPARVIRGRAGRGTSALGVSVADVNQILLDLLRFLPWSEAEPLAYRAAQRSGPRVFTLLSQATSTLGPAPGAAQLRRIVDLLGSGARSHAEQEIVALLVSAGFTGFRPNHPVRVAGRLYFIDIAFPEHMLAVEVDGMAST